MEVLLRPSSCGVIDETSVVSILVLMEVLLRLDVDEGRGIGGSGVSILVLMEVLLRPWSH